MEKLLRLNQALIERVEQLTSEVEYYRSLELPFRQDYPNAEERESIKHEMLEKLKKFPTPE